MKFAIITHVQHIKNQDQYFGYAPYIREMNIWLKYVEKVTIVAPLVNKQLNPIHENYIHSHIDFRQVKEFDITSVSNIFKTIIKLPNIVIQVYKAMSEADHIHLRCPGNMGLIGALVQVLFPKKSKTAKYAGNWDPKSKQPLSYRFQKWLLSNTFLTKNMCVLVYGDWPNQTKNIKPFFTATYSENEILNSKVETRRLDSDTWVKFLFVGGLTPGKQPIYSVKIIEQLLAKQFKICLDIYGDGVEKDSIQKYIVKKNLSKQISLLGNRSKEEVLKAYQTAHFLILPSKSEGWPKVVAEAMFWGCVPIVSQVSCVPYMLEQGNRGVLLDMELEKDICKIVELLKRQSFYYEKAEKAKVWSQQYTVEFFESEIKKLLI